MDRRVYDNYIIQIVKQGNLSKAAAYLGISQPALSSGLSTFENELGFKIFDRKRVPISFTAEGQLYYDYIIKIQVLTDDLNNRLACHREGAEQRVVIGGPVAYIESIVTDAIIKLRKSNPEYRVTVKASPMPELIEAATRGELNCFISTRQELPAVFEKKLISNEKMYLCIPKVLPINKILKEYQTYPGGTGKLLDYSLLSDHSFIQLEKGQPLREQTDRFFADNKIAAKSMITVNQVSTALNLAIKGEGICFASEYALEANTDLSGICIYSLPASISGRNIYIAYNRELYMPACCKALITCLVN